MVLDHFVKLCYLGIILQLKKLNLQIFQQSTDVQAVIDDW